MTSEISAVPRGRRYARGVADVVSASRVGSLLRDWRRRRRLSQLDLALEAGVSARHISFVETGRSRPSAEMVLLLAEQLDVPLRDRNQLLLAAGYAPVYGQRGLDEPEMGAVSETLDLVLRGHEPYPAVVLDRHWGMVAGNGAVALLTRGVAQELLEPPVNVLRLSLHPDGLAPRIVNLAEWRAHLLDRLGRQAVSTGDPALAALYEELSDLPGGGQPGTIEFAAGEIAMPLSLRVDDAVLSFISTNTSFGTATDITVAELSIESFFPADPPTAAAMQAFTGQAGRS
jgi:transcriptional regulator with XRE-family HTH domain